MRQCGEIKYLINSQGTPWKISPTLKVRQEAEIKKKENKLGTVENICNPIS